MPTFTQRIVGPIESGIPVPHAGNRRYKWRQMKVGQSFLVEYRPCKYKSELRKEKRKLLNTLTSCKAYVKRTTRMQFVLQVEGNQGVRVFRIA